MILNLNSQNITRLSIVVKEKRGIMIINGLENNYYLTQNDIWVIIDGFTEVVAKVIIDFKNLSTNQEINGFECSSSPNNECYFNVCFPIRALMPEPNHIENNSLQSFQIKVTAKFKNAGTPDEVITMNKYFIRGGKDKSGVNEWHLNDGDFLIDNYWITGGKAWTADSQPLKISGGTLIQDSSYPLQVEQQERKNCDGIIIKYLNSLGCYQFFYFDRFEFKSKTKASKAVSRIATRLRNENFQNNMYEGTNTLSLFAWTEKKLQSNFTDLIKSPQLFYFDQNGNDTNSSWHLLKLDDNSSTWNNYENVYENKAEFTLPNYRTIQL